MFVACDRRINVEQNRFFRAHLSSLRQCYQVGQKYYILGCFGLFAALAGGAGKVTGPDGPLIFNQPRVAKQVLISPQYCAAMAYNPDDLASKFKYNYKLLLNFA